MKVITEPKDEWEQECSNDLKSIIKDTVRSIRNISSNKSIIAMLKKRGVNMEDALALILELRARISEEIRSRGCNNALFGMLWCFAGSFLILIAYSAVHSGGSGSVKVFWGPAAYGGLKMIKGLTQLAYARLIRN